MTLGTIGVDGTPNARSLLLSSFSDGQLRFHTDVRSRKVAEMRRHPDVSLTIAWAALGRQVVVRGRVEEEDASRSAAAYALRPYYLQLLAWQNTPQAAELPLDARRRSWEQFADLHPPGSLAPPTTWAGFGVSPRKITFWFADDQGPSNRHEYERTGDAWSRTSLPG
ncbi:pyridoxamine 5'-phosphate oxidase family protein [Microbacterium sp. SLBN-154]|uniref:pyridoxamine 5'-phosphate oxidase family protein n=1 Tax=Microbacterium sp. SLBN-154 TaxID=2768458 RepID=UPI001F231FA8|nr:pyridoxamine 5'-phosphate oxidase family protein [Microbacterium sp. SLBN-154]